MYVRTERAGRVPLAYFALPLIIGALGGVADLLVDVVMGSTASGATGILVGMTVTMGWAVYAALLGVTLGKVGQGAAKYASTDVRNGEHSG